ncbi:metallophosphoesterase [Streptomyces sp. V4-01]|uniref:Metallophosphoesterase n=1 Tax=Actinacidiphila polyblastidii TaxID=3110430 RepID=A0ABU7PC22_9ACTN|nr:metallophosphoesterase [Streptomyces sp. V4-01]
MPARVLQLSDIHFRGDGADVEGRAPDDRLRRVLDAWRRTERPVDLVVLTGDLADDGSHAACRRLADALAPLSAPVVAVPGNHDRAGVVRAVFAADSATVGGWDVVGVDTSRPEQIHGTVDVAAVAERLDSGDGRPTLLALHHPPVGPSAHRWFQLEGAEGLLAALAQRPQVRAIISGHLHDPFEMRAHTGLPVLGCPSTLVAFRHTGAEVVVGGGDVTGARLLELAEDGTVSSEVLAA